MDSVPELPWATVSVDGEVARAIDPVPELFTPTVTDALALEVA
jgi:hypothetical protein